MARFFWVGIVFSLVVQTQISHAAVQCKSIVEAGIFREVSSWREEKLYNYIRQHECQKQKSERISSDQWHIIYDTFSMRRNDRRYNIDVDDICRTFVKDSSYKLKEFFEDRFFDTGLESLLENCSPENGAPLVKAKLPENGNKIYLTISYFPRVNTTEKIRYEIDATDIACNPNSVSGSDSKLDEFNDLPATRSDDAWKKNLEIDVEPFKYNYLVCKFDKTKKRGTLAVLSNLQAPRVIDLVQQFQANYDKCDVLLNSSVYQLLHSSKTLLTPDCNSADSNKNSNIKWGGRSEGVEGYISRSSMPKFTTYETFPTVLARHFGDTPNCWRVFQLGGHWRIVHPLRSAALNPNKDFICQKLDE
ncbi:MAG: hypothetical protein RDA78_25680 [Roseibium sp.]|uniref:hypothetical protein n=1 Tax=Roseibium sp. TaxID=1936156 RepID=UPI003D9C3F75